MNLNYIIHMLKKKTLKRCSPLQASIYFLYI